MMPFYNSESGRQGLPHENRFVTTSWWLPKNPTLIYAIGTAMADNG